MSVDAGAPRWALWRFAAVGAILIAVAVAGVFMVRVARAPAPAPAGSAPVSTARGRDIPLPTGFALALEKPALMMPERPATTGGGGRDAYADALASALTPFEQNDFAAAADRLKAVVRSYPDRPDAAFYLGASLLLSNRPLNAITPLTDAARLGAADPWLSDEAAWYRAVALERAGNPEGALNALAPLCSGRGSHREAACRGMSALASRVPGRAMKQGTEGR